MRLRPRIVVEHALLALALAFPASASTAPDVVREFFVRYAAGDARSAAELWVAGAPADEFLREHARRLERRCIRLESLTVHADPADASRVETAQTLAFRGRRPQSSEWLETARSRFVLKHDGARWRIAEWQSRERELVEQLVNAADANARAAILETARDLRTTTLVRLLSLRAVDMTNQRRFDVADALSSAAMHIADELGDASSMAAALSARSVVERIAKLTDLETSVEHARGAISLALIGGDPDILGRTLYRYARGRELVDGIPDLDSLQRAMELVVDVDDPSLPPLVATHLSRAYEIRGVKRQAVHYAIRAGQYAEETTDASARINAWLIVGAAYLWLGEPFVAMRYYRRAYELAIETKFTGAIAVAAGGMSASAFSGEDALRLIDEGLSHISNAADRQFLLRTRASVLNAMGRFDEAEKTVQDALAAAPPDAESRQSIALLHASIARNRGDHAAALAHLERARGPNATLDGVARHWRAAVLQCLGQRDEAIRLLEELIAETELNPIVEPQTSLFRNDVLGVHRLLVDLLLEGGEVHHALEVLEEAKANDLRVAVRDRKTDELRMTPREKEQVTGLEQRIQTLNRMLYGGQPSPAEAAALREQLREAQIDLIELRQAIYTPHAPRALPHPDVRPRLEELPPHLDDVTFLSYVAYGAWTSVFVIEPKREGRRRVSVRAIGSGGKDLATRVTRFATLVEQRNLRANDAAAEMYDLLLRPVAPMIAGAKRLCIIPDATLWHVPFHALGPRGGPPLIARMPVFYAPSLSVLAATAPREQRPRNVLAVANPSVSATTASLYRSFVPDAATGAIPEAESEVRAIGRIYGGTQSRIYVGADARESVLKREAPRYDVLHIATHGMIHQYEPMFSSLLLTATADDGEDGLLEAREISELELNADLAVLSACETGKAEDLNGDGVVALSWALLAAGVRTTMVSQWKAQSAATAALMVEFHRRLAKGTSKPEALREAQLAVRARREYRHPFYWAPFVLIGAP